MQPDALAGAVQEVRDAAEAELLELLPVPVKVVDVDEAEQAGADHVLVVVEVTWEALIDARRCRADHRQHHPMS